MRRAVAEFLVRVANRLAGTAPEPPAAKRDPQLRQMIDHAQKAWNFAWGARPRREERTGDEVMFLPPGRMKMPKSIDGPGDFTPPRF